MPTSEPRASPSGRTWVVTRKRSWVSIRSASGVQSIVMLSPERGVRRASVLIHQRSGRRSALATPAAIRWCTNRPGIGRGGRAPRRSFRRGLPRANTAVSSPRGFAPAPCRRAIARPRWRRGETRPGRSRRRSIGRSRRPIISTRSPIEMIFAPADIDGPPSAASQPAIATKPATVSLT